MVTITRFVFIVLSVCLLAIVPLSLDAQSDKPVKSDHSGFFLGVGGYQCTDIFVLTGDGVELVEASSSSVGAFGGYSFIPGRAGDFGYGCGIAFTKFGVPDFKVDINTDKVPYTNVQYSILFIDPSIAIRASHIMIGRLYFVFGVTFESHVHPAHTWIISGGLIINRYENVEESRTNFAGGGGFGADFEIWRGLTAKVDLRWVVGRTTGGGEYHLIQNGADTGDVGGSSEYMSMHSLGLAYNF